MNAGIAMLDFTGITTGTHAELANQIRAAIRSGKIIVGYGINGRSPVVLSTIDDGELAGNGVDITVADDAIVISNLLPNSVKIMAQPQNASVTEGSPAVFAVTATGASTLSYQWYSRTAESAAWTKSNFSGNKTAELTVSGAITRNGYQYCCIVSDMYSSAATNPATLTIISAQDANPGYKYGEVEEVVKKTAKK